MAIRRLLLVEDDAEVRDMLTELFTASDMDVVSAGNAIDALKELSTNNIQVMLLDLKLPDMDGFSLCRKIRKFNPIAPVFAMTAYTSIFELADARDAGFDDYFIKPIDTKLLVQAIIDAFEMVERWKRKN